MPPEVGDGKAPVAPAGNELQGPVAVGTAFPLLLLPGLVADGWPQVDLATLGDRAVAGAHHHAQTGLLEDAGVVVVGVAHGPAAQVALRLLLVAAVDETHVAVRPLAEAVKVSWLLQRHPRTAIKFIHPKPHAASF